MAFQLHPEPIPLLSRGPHLRRPPGQFAAADSVLTQMALKIVKDSKALAVRIRSAESVYQREIQPRRRKTSGRDIKRICTNKKWTRPKAAPIYFSNTNCQIPNTVQSAGS